MLIARLNLMGFHGEYGQRFGLPFAWHRSGIDYWEYSWLSLLLNIMLAFLGLARLLHLRKRELQGTYGNANDRAIPPLKPTNESA